MWRHAWANPVPAQTPGDFAACPPPPPVTVDMVREDRHIRFVVHNHQTCDMTVTLTADLDNLRPSKPLPYTATYGGGANVTALLLEPIDETKAARPDHVVYHFEWGPRDVRHDFAARYRLPYESGTSHKVIQGFGGTFSHQGDFRYAIDWAMPPNTRVLAAREGVVVECNDGFGAGGPDRKFAYCVNTVIVRHPDGTYGEYDHLIHNGVRVRVGQKVRAGDLLALSGNSGFTSQPHLHFMVYRAIDGMHRQSYPIHYEVAGAEDAVLLREGVSYTAR